MDANLKDVVTAALRICRQHGSKADLVELAYTACLIDEQGSWHTPGAAAEDPPPLSLTLLNSGQKLPEQALTLMAGQLAQLLMSPQDPALAATAALQIAVEQSYGQQQDKVEAEQTQQAAEASRLATAVAYKKVNLDTAGLKDYQAVFELVVNYVCAAAGLASRTSQNDAARAEVSAAVESAFPLSGVAYFISLPAVERLQQLESLARVVCGICLFNAANNSSPAAAALLPPSAAAQIPQAHKLLEAIQAALHDAEMAFQHHNTPAAAAAAAAGGDRCSGLGPAVFCLQCVVSLRRLSADLCAGMRCCEALEEGITAALQEAGRVVSGSLSGVPKDIVFPLFESAGRLHLALSGELRLLLVRARLWEDTCSALEAAVTAAPAQCGSNRSVPNILGFSKSHGIGATSSAGSRATSAAGGGALSASDLADLPPDMQYVAPEAMAAATADMSSAACSSDWQVALGGLCPVSLAHSDCAAVGTAAAAPPEKVLGQLANSSLGCIRYNAALLGFASSAAMQSFLQSPQTVLEGVRTAVHNVPLLAHLLGLTGCATSGSSCNTSGHLFGADQMVATVPPLRQIMQLFEVPVKVDAVTQTQTHLLERNIDINYEWNEWALRRRIIALANLRNKATHSAQTVLSHFRRDGDSQTWLPKAAAVQTQVNKGTTMPKKLRYVAGLRGAPPPPGKKSQVTVVSLELDIGQTHQF